METTVTVDDLWREIGKQHMQILSLQKVVQEQARMLADAAAKLVEKANVQPTLCADCGPNLN